MLNKIILIVTAVILTTGLSVTMPSSVVSAGSVKMEVCHLPPGNPENFHTIKISENAYGAHLAHFDLQGACNGVCAEVCDDGDACTVDDTGDCETAGCPVERAPTDCDDGNFCTVDSCDSALGCENTPVTCDSGYSCFEGTGSCAPDLCDPVTYQGKEYWICQAARTQVSAKTYCESEGMQLAYIDDEDENTFVVDKVLELHPYDTYANSTYWIGNLEAGTELYWESGNPIWSSGEPNNAGEECVLLLRYENQPYGWNDAYCDRSSVTRGWVCEAID